MHEELQSERDRRERLYRTLLIEEKIYMRQEQNKYINNPNSLTYKLACKKIHNRPRNGVCSSEVYVYEEGRSEV